MAEINIEKKKNNIWPWIIGILIVLALLWAFTRYRNNNASVTPADTTTIQGTAPAQGGGAASSTRP
jgi:integral membrane sensor domain MASE1